MTPNTQFVQASSTEAYLAQIPHHVQQQATEYTHGNHWLILFSALVAVVINLIIIRFKLLDRLRARWERRRPRPWSAAFVVSLAYCAAVWALGLPWTLYSTWWREVHYGLSPQGAGAWLAEKIISASFSGLLMATMLMLLYALMRRAPRTWWIWSSVVTSATIAFAMLIVPVTLQPLFNKYEPLAAGHQRQVIEALAQRAAIPADRIFAYDGSKQSSNYTANVSGLYGSARIAVSDALLQQASEAELRAVVGHEIGHYVLHHSLVLVFAYSALLTLAFFVTHRLQQPLATVLGATGLGAAGNPAGLPLLSIIVTVVFLVLTPLTNGVVRWVENQADVYSLEAANEPDGMAVALLRTADYRAANPGKVEEWLFYDHPSIARRIGRALEWKAQHAGR